MPLGEFMNWLKRMSLRTKIVLFISVIIMVLGASSFIALKEMHSESADTIMSELESMAGAIGDSIGAQFFERYGDVQAFALNKDIKSMNSESMQSSLDSYIELYGIYDLILVVDKNGRFVASNSKDANGNKVDKSKIQTFDYSNEPWFKAAINGQFTEDKEKNFSGTYFEDLNFDPYLKMAFSEARYGTGFTTVIKNEKGQITGVITNRANAKWIETEFLYNYSSMKAIGNTSTEYVMLNKEGAVLVDFDPSANNFKNEIVHNPEILMKFNLALAGNQAAQAVIKGNRGHIFSIHAHKK